MNQGYISHRAAFNECYALDENQLEIRIKTGYDVTGVNLYYGDPYSSGIMGGAEQWVGTSIAMKREAELRYQQVWSVTVRPEHKRCKYYFEIQDEKETVYYFEDGSYTGEKLELQGRKEQYFFFPWMNASDIAMTPDWAGDTVWYQIFPDRFCNGDSRLNPPNTKKWNSKDISYQDIYGGDLKGIIGKIPYLKELGMTGIYLTPIFAAESNHKYNTTDYYKIDESFGTDAEMKELVEQAHAAGIRVMLDAVFNHCGTKFAPWQDVLERGPESEYYEWFFVNQWPFHQNDNPTREGKYFSFAFHGGMPKLNTNNEGVVRYFTEICRSWLREWKIDGIRFDVGNEVSHSFLKQLRRELKKINPGVYLLGEIWHDSISWLQGDEYDSVMNYPLAQSINDFFVDREQTAKDFKYSINRCFGLYYRQMNRVLFNLLDSHDTDRLYTRAGNTGKFLQQLAVLFTMEGSPCIYYGTEIAMPGGHDPDCRRCMPWEEIEKGVYEKETEAVKKLIQIRREQKSCRSRNIEWKECTANRRVIWYEKGGEQDDRIGVLINASEETYPHHQEGEILFSYGYAHDCVQMNGVLIYKIKSAGRLPH